jgi:hypothetical protein
VPAILTQPVLGLPCRLNAVEVEHPAASIRTGIDPEAPPKPPKSFA